MQIFPGNKVLDALTGVPLKTGLDALAPKIPKIPPPLIPTPPPEREDPEISAARKKQRATELRRKGRRSTILTSGRGITDPLGTVSRPEARTSELLGG